MCGALYDLLFPFHVPCAICVMLLFIPMLCFFPSRRSEADMPCCAHTVRRLFKQSSHFGVLRHYASLQCYIRSPPLFQAGPNSTYRPIKQSLYCPLNASNRLYVYPTNGKLISAISSFDALASLALMAAVLSSCGISSIGKYAVSILLDSLGSNGARTRLKLSKSTPEKKGCCLISGAPVSKPSLSLASQMNERMRSSGSGFKG